MAKRKKQARTPDETTTKAFERMLKEAGTEKYVLRLYVTGSTARSSQAIANIRALCDEYLPGRYDLEVIDIYQQPTVAFGEQIIAAPTLIKKLPHPPRRMVGDLADRKRVMVGLDLQENGKPAASPEAIKWVEL